MKDPVEREEIRKGLMGATIVVAILTTAIVAIWCQVDKLPKLEEPVSHEWGFNKNE